MFILCCRFNEGNLSPANFDALAYLEKHIKAEKSDNEVDWIHGIKAAVEYLDSEAQLLSTMMNLGNRKIVLISDLACPSDAEGYDELLEEVTRKNIEIVFLWVKLSFTHDYVAWKIRVLTLFYYSSTDALAAISEM